jgi:hypothetical protein
MIKKIISADLSMTSAVGIPHLLRANNWGLRLMWTVCYAIGTILTIYMIIQNILDFNMFTVSTKIRKIDVNSLPFPRITICNLDPFVTNSSIAFLANVIKLDASYNHSNFSSDLDMVNYYVSFEPSFHLKALFTAKNASETLKSSLGYNQSIFFLSCKFGGSNCNSINNFEITKIYDYQFGNCYSINSNITKPILETKIAGKNNGLQLELLAGKADNYHSFSTSAGVIIYIHNQTSYYTSLDSIELGVGTDTNIVLSNVIVEKLSKPYSDCTIDSFPTVDSAYYNAFLKQNKTYRFNDCFHICFQLNLLNEFNCIDPFKRFFDLFNNATVNKFCLSQTEYNNENNDNENIINRNTDKFIKQCLNDCENECSIININKQTSFLRYPLENYEYKLKKKFSYLNTFQKSLREKILKLNIFYQDISYDFEDELPAINLVGLLSNIGGALGLFLGIAVLTFVEFVETLIKIAHYLLCTKIKPNENLPN